MTIYNYVMQLAAAKSVMEQSQRADDKAREEFLRRLRNTQGVRVLEYNADYHVNREGERVTRRIQDGGKTRNLPVMIHRGQDRDTYDGLKSKQSTKRGYVKPNVLKRFRAA